MQKHRNLERHIRHQIATGELLPGKRLPSGLKLSSEHGLSVGTVRRALNTLVHEGILAPRRGSGVYVQKKPRQKIIGVMVPNLFNPDHARLVHAVSGGAAKRGYATAIFCRQNPGGAYDSVDMPELQFIEHMAAMNVAGVVACPTRLPIEARVRAQLRAAKVPFVAVNNYWSDCRQDDHVCADQEAAARMAVDHLAALGHRRIGFWMEVAEDEWPGAAAAFRQRLRECELPECPESVFTGAGEEWIARALRSAAEPFTAVIAPYSDRASTLFATLRAAGVDVPGELSLIALSGIPNSFVQGTDLTATISPIEEVAEQALNLLTDGERNGVRRRYLYKPTLHLGATAAPPVVRMAQSASTA